MALANEVFQGSFRRQGGVVSCELQSCRLDLKPDEADLQCRVGKVGGGGGEDWPGGTPSVTVCMWVGLYACIRVCEYVCMRVGAHICVCVCMCVCV